MRNAMVLVGTMNRLFGGAVTDAIELAVVAVLVVGIIGLVVLRRRAQAVTVQDMLSGLFFVLLTVLLATTLAPGHRGMVPRINLMPGCTIIEQISHTPGRISTTNLVGNVLLFAFPALLARAGLGWSKRKTVIAGFALSVAIETLQLALHLGRSTDIDDVLLNTLGAFTGAWIGALASRRIAFAGTASAGERA